MKKSIPQIVFMFILVSIISLLTGCSEEPKESAVLNKTEINQYKASQHGKNLIVIQLEAYQNFVLNVELDGKEVTPNLNRLAREGIYFPNFYQQNGAGTTSDAEFMFNTSMYPLKPPVSIATGKTSREFVSLPRILDHHHYQSLTFHTNNVLFWNRIELYSALGFDQYYDREFFGRGDRISFGASDEVLFEKTLPVLEELHRKNENFYAQLVTTSSHHSFRIPERKNPMPLPQELDGTITGRLFQAANYVDRALGVFLDELERAGIMEDSLLVLYGDHLGLKPDYLETEAEKAFLKELVGRDYDIYAAMNVPFIMYANDLEPQTITEPAGHMDMLPTVAYLLDIPLDQAHIFGKNMLEPNNRNDHIIGFRGYVPHGSYLKGNEVFLADERKIIRLSDGQVKEPDNIDQYLADAKALEKDFVKSDDIGESLPQKEDYFGKEITFHEAVDAYLTPDNQNAEPVKQLQPTTTLYYQNTKDGWYEVREQGEEYWIKPKHPIIERFGYLPTNGETQLYPVPDNSIEPRASSKVRNFYIAKEWVGMDWYQVFTWLEADMWVNIDLDQ